MYDEDKNRNRNTIAAVLGVLLVGALVAIFFLKAHKPESVAAPTALKAYVVSDKTFACQVPSDWTRQETGGMGIRSGVDVHKATADIDISSDLEGSLMGDIARSSNAQSESLQSEIANAPITLQNTNALKVRPAVEQLHDAGMSAVASSVENYDEKPMQEFHSELGEARLSEWTGEKKELLSTVKIHGYRATILGGERRVVYVARCSESDWPHLKNTFMTVLGSLKNGGG